MMQTEVEKLVKATEAKMQLAVEAVSRNLSTVRTGRAHPSIIDGIKVDYYGTKTPIKQLAHISTPEPRTIVIQPWDKSSMELIEKAILLSEVGMAPVNDGKAIRLSMPQLTQERRDELVKVIHKMAEEGKVSIRNARHHANMEADKKEKDNSMTEDDKFSAKDKVQKLTDDYTKRIDTALAEKEKEIRG